jgi:hypothetical protein
MSYPEIRGYRPPLCFHRVYKQTKTTKQTPWPSIRKRTIPTDRPATGRRILVPTFVDRGVSRGQRSGTPTAINLSF